MEVITRARGSVKEAAMQVTTVCARMALTASALIHVDLPDALDPVTSTLPVQQMSLGTGFLISGCTSPCARMHISSVNAGSHTVCAPAR